MRALLEKKFFPHVIKPGRYAGGEPGQIVKSSENRINYLIAFPDKYELGQSYMGLQTLYHVVNDDDRFLAERVFAVDRDAEEIMRREGIPLFSLESSRPAAEFDAIGFTLPYELVFTNVLTMLDLAGIPLHTCDRDDSHPLVFAGGPAVYNPEPMAAFVDVFFIGDAEEGLPELLGVLYETRGSSRAERLRALAKRVESVYVPALYDEAHQPLDDAAPEKIRARLMRELRPEFYADQPILPLIETVHDHLSVEVMRGCPQGCRFCQAGPMYRPVRARSQPDILRQVEMQLRHTGYHEISLVSLSSSDYPGIDKLADTISRRVAEQRVSISLPALRPGSISPKLLESARRVRKSGLTLAPEAGTERLRAFIRKDFPDSAIYDSVRIAFEKEWSTLKLYFMVGLPTETDEDLMGIVDVIRNIHEIGREYAGKKTINVTLSPFVPKPHTPFQWDGMFPPEELLRRINLVRRRNRVRGVNFKHHNVESSMLQCVLGRGGRDASGVIESVYREGCRFDGWSEDFEPNKWFDALGEAGIDIQERLKPIPFGSRLPWSHISKGPSEEHLSRERQRTSTQLRDFAPRFKSEPAPTGSAAVEYGRGRKRVAGRNLAAPTKNQVRLLWGKNARYRYMSHLDNMRLIERALRRAQVPVAYSQGFNPTMKLSFCPPLPLGFTSESELVDIVLDTPLVASMIDRLKDAMPDGVDIIDARVVYGKPLSLSAALNRVRYVLPTDDLDTEIDLAASVSAIVGADTLNIERTSKGRTKTVDVRGSIYDLHVTDGILDMILGIGEGGYVRPTEVVQLLLGRDDKLIASLPFHRRDLYRQDDEGRVIAGIDV